MPVSPSQDQIEAARTIRQRLNDWQEADATLRRLNEVMPGFRGEAALLKVAAINTLYGTNLYAFQRMAMHIEKVLEGRRPSLSPELVERIAAIPTLADQQPRHHISFASKFCHFFLDGETFPIYDTRALQMVAFHLGRERRRDLKHPYLSFVENVQRLLTEARLTVSRSDLDSYLWIRGSYELWRKPNAPPIGGELKTFFMQNEGERLLKRLTGELP